jgi:hypothetical protein
VDVVERKDIERMLYIFERCFRNCKFDERDIDLYWWKLKGYPRALVRQAVDRISDSNESFSPTPGQVKHRIAEMVDRSPSGEIAWTEAREAGRSFTPYADDGQQQWSSPAVAEAVRAIGGLEEIGYCDHDQISYLRHYFLQVYEGIRRQEQEQLMRDPALVARRYAELEQREQEALPGRETQA